VHSSTAASDDIRAATCTYTTLPQLSRDRNG
jgi:hypothetical protein